MLKYSMVLLNHDMVFNKGKLSTSPNLSKHKSRISKWPVPKDDIKKISVKNSNFSYLGTNDTFDEDKKK